MKEYFPVTNHFETRIAALKYLDKHPLGCVTWDEDNKKMSAIYWNGKHAIQKSPSKKHWK